MSDPTAPQVPHPMRPKIRLYVEQPLHQGQQVPLSEGATHYLFSVMRLAPGAEVALFDGQSGEFAARVQPQGKRGALADVGAQTAPFRAPADLWLIFAPVKKARTDFMVEKAVELGVARLVPVQTDYTNSERLRADRMRANAIEAAEQCGATHLPQIADMTPLPRLLADWDPSRQLFWADEGLADAPTALSATPGPAAVLIGPEGGFSPAERARLGGLPFVRRLRLGPRILRAETAAAAALVLWQSRFGDWADDSA